MLGFNAIIDIDLSYYPIILIYDFKRRLTNSLLSPSPFSKHVLHIFEVDHKFCIPRDLSYRAQLFMCILLRYSALFTL